MRANCTLQACAEAKGKAASQISGELCVSSQNTVIYFQLIFYTLMDCCMLCVYEGGKKLGELN